MTLPFNCEGITLSEEAIRLPDQSNRFRGVASTHLPPVFKKLLPNHKLEMKLISNASDPFSLDLGFFKKLKDSGFLDHYMLFTNRKLSGLRDPILEQRITEGSGASNCVLGLEQIHLYLEGSPSIVRQMELNKLLMPLEFYEDDSLDYAQKIDDLLKE